MKKILSLILCTLLLLTNVSVFAENVDDFWLYGGDYPSDDGRKIEFGDQVIFDNPTSNSESVEFLFDGKNWDKDKTISLNLVLTPSNNKYKTIISAFELERGATTWRNGVREKVEYNARTKVTDICNNEATPLYYSIEIKWEDEVVFVSEDKLIIPGKSEVKDSEPQEEFRYQWSASGINVAVDNKNILFPDQKPLLETNTSRTYVPVRFLAENLGAKVDWNNDYQVVEILNEYIEGKDTKQKHYLKIGENKFITVRYKDNTFSSVDNVYVFELPQNVAPTLVNDRTMLPFRYVAELLGAQVYYDDVTNTAHCVKRDMSRYDGKAQVISTILGDYFVEEQKIYRRQQNGKDVKNDIVFNGSIGDIGVWACFDKLEHPEWRAKDAMGTEFIHTFSNSTIVGEGAWKPFYQKYFGGQIKITGTIENAIVLDDPIYNYGKKSGLEKEKLQSEIVKWGIVKNDSTIDYHLLDEIAYRELSREIISAWHISTGHRGALLNSSLKQIGIAMVEGYVYYHADF